MEHNHEEDMGCPMIMTFHAGSCEAILFKKTTVKNAEEMVLAVVVIFVIAIAYEGLKFWREKLYIDFSEETNGSCCSKKGNTAELTCEEHKTNIQKRPIRQLLTHKIHLSQTLLHFVQVAISYALMLIVMTYNVWLILSVVLGATVGYFLFGWIRHRLTEEHCH